MVGRKGRGFGVIRQFGERFGHEGEPRRIRIPDVDEVLDAVEASASETHNHE